MGSQARSLFCWLCLQVVFASVLSDVWKAEVVDKMNVLVTSCVVVPCTFNYPGTPLPDSRIRGIWHKKDRKEIIYHADQIEVADSFKGRTKLVGRLGKKNCTLEIDSVTDHDNGPFCFRAEIPSLDKYSFVEECVDIFMMWDPEKPRVEIKQTLEEGAVATVKCTVRHTCPSYPPTITWSHFNSEASVSNRDSLHGMWEVDSLLTFIPKEEDNLTDLTCTVAFHGGKSSAVTTRLHVTGKANYFHIIIPVAAVLGIALLFGGVCYFMRKKYKVYGTNHKTKKTTVHYRSVTYKYRKSLEKKLVLPPYSDILTSIQEFGAEYPGCPEGLQSMGSQARSLFCWLCLQVVFASVLSDVWKAEVVDKMNVLVTSCVVVPCTFNYPGTPLPDSRIRGIWHKENKKEIIYHADQIEVVDSFKGRTKLVGRLGKKNCTLEIDSVTDHDNGPFCFRAEIPSLDKYSFVEECVDIFMMWDPEKPRVEIKQTLEEGAVATVKCTVRHTCPSYPPTITWSHFNSEASVSNRDSLHGVWEVDSLLTFIPNKEDNLKDLTCTVTFHGGKSSAVTTRLHVTGKANYFHIIIPVATVVGIALLFGGVCYFMRKKYKREIQELQSRNDNGIWSRMSRMSRRFRSVGPSFQGNQKEQGNEYS
ncbi:hypothetical protein NFI96_019433 [Prochilodus magdalenae]|nr:hypothetical protein NFI96_019433 [Prochilodus magdalenae]